MRKDKCLFCNSKNCLIRIVANNGKYDEIACGNHKELLKQHASNQSKDKEFVVKETTGPQKRGDSI